MINPKKMTQAQKEIFYREAVLATLMSIYGKSKTDSQGLVASWWKRVSESKDTQSDLFFHAEPLHVAADLARTRSIEITEQNEKTYRIVLRQARRHALEKSEQATKKAALHQVIARG